MSSLPAEIPPTAPWAECPTIQIDLGRPHHLRYADVPAEAIDRAKALLQALRKELPPKLRRLVPLIRLRTLNRFHREVVSLARIAQADWRDVMLANVSYELVLAAFGCSTVALPTTSGPVLARNMDWWPENVLARASCLVRFERNRRMQFCTAGWPGSVGVVTGLSARGFAVALNAVMGPEPFSRLGYPVLLHLRRVVEDARDFADALRRLSRQRLTAPALFTLVGTANEERVVIERSPRRHALRWAEGGAPLVATNDYRKLFQPTTSSASVIYETTCRRFDALCRLLGMCGRGEAVSDERLLYVLTDASVLQTITAQHVIMRPRTRQMRVFVPRRFVGGVRADGEGDSIARLGL